MCFDDGVIRVDGEGTIDKVLIEGGDGGEEIGEVLGEKFLLIGEGWLTEFVKFVEDVSLWELKGFHVLVFGH